MTKVLGYARTKVPAVGTDLTEKIRSLIAKYRAAEEERNSWLSDFPDEEDMDGDQYLTSGEIRTDMAYDAEHDLQNLLGELEESVRER